MGMAHEIYRSNENKKRKEQMPRAAGQGRIIKQV